MNRDIGKYRGQRKDNGEWVYGDVIHFPATTTIGHPDKDGVCWEEYDVIPETVGEFTGLYDKERSRFYPKGKEIFFDDKVTWGKHKRTWVVVWSQKLAGVYLQTLENYEMQQENTGTVPLLSNFGEGQSRYSEVIGNIHSEK